MLQATVAGEWGLSSSLWVSITHHMLFKHAVDRWPARPTCIYHHHHHVHHAAFIALTVATVLEVQRPWDEARCWADDPGGCAAAPAV
jgi:hypothetical protein